MAVHIHPRPAAPTPAPMPPGPALPEHDITVNGSVITARDVAAETRYGLLVVQLHRHMPARSVAFEGVAEDVARDLARACWGAAARQFIAVLASRAKVGGSAFDGVASFPLVR